MVLLLAVARVVSFWEPIFTSSLPALSSMRISFEPLPPGEDAVWSAVRDFPSGSAYGGMNLPLNTLPVTIGRSGLPSRNSTITSHPTRGRIIEPLVCCWEVRIQHEAVSSWLP